MALGASPGLAKTRSTNRSWTQYSSDSEGHISTATSTAYAMFLEPKLLM
jgi:hypothetical protein